MRNPLDKLLRRPPATAPIPTFFWAEVTSVSPLTIQPDGTTTPWVGPSNVAPGLVVGSRVFVVLSGRKPTILGKAQ